MGKNEFIGNIYNYEYEIEPLACTFNLCGADASSKCILNICRNNVSNCSGNWFGTCKAYDF